MTFLLKNILHRIHETFFSFFSKQTSAHYTLWEIHTPQGNCKYRSDGGQLRNTYTVTKLNLTWRWMTQHFFFRSSTRWLETVTIFFVEKWNVENRRQLSLSADKGKCFYNSSMSMAMSRWLSRWRRDVEMLVSRWLSTFFSMTQHNFWWICRWICHSEYVVFWTYPIDEFFGAGMMPNTPGLQNCIFLVNRPTGTLRVNFQSFCSIFWCCAVLLIKFQFETILLQELGLFRGLIQELNK